MSSLLCLPIVCYVYATLYQVIYNLLAIDSRVGKKLSVKVDMAICSCLDRAGMWLLYNKQLSFVCIHIDGQSSHVCLHSESVDCNYLFACDKL